MSPREIRQWLVDILATMEETISFTDGMSKAEFFENRSSVKVVMMNFIIIGEAAGSIPEELQEKHPEVPWQEMKRMRNKVVHVYFGVNRDILWKTARHDLPPLVPQLRAILNDLEK